jgi:hypothetical protein
MQKRTPPFGGVLIGGVSGFALHFADGKIKVSLCQATASNAHPNCNLSFKSLSLNANANKMTTLSGGHFIGGVRGI